MPSLSTSAVMIAKEAFAALFGFCFFNLFLLPKSIWRHISSGNAAVEARQQAKRDSLRMLTDEAVAKVAAMCDEDYKGTVKSQQVELDTGISMHCVVGGDPRKSDSMILLLHGFPECWYTWNEILPMLVNKGHFVVAPDMRGYGLTSCPPDINEYFVSTMADDFRVLIAQLKTPKTRTVTCVAHDWGGGAGAELARMDPIVVDGVCLINFPHPATAESGLIYKYAPWQIFMSWYMFYFNIPGVTEYINSAVPIMSKVNRGHSKFGQTLMDAVHATSLRTMLHYYRALIRSLVSEVKLELTEKLAIFWKFGPSPPPHAASATKNRPPLDFKVPFLQIWGTADTALDTAFADIVDENQEMMAPQGFRLVKLEGTSHWVPTEKPREVADNVHRFIDDMVALPKQ